MPINSHGLHHFHKRKRVSKEKYPSSSKSKRFMDRAIYGVGIFGPIMTIPQLMNIWVYKNAVGVSVISWTSYLFVAIFWLGYGIMHKEKPIIFTYCMWILLDLLIVVGVLLY
jgi:uncharacterized protein with PQ loop repeat